MSNNVISTIAIMARNALVGDATLAAKITKNSAVKVILGSAPSYMEFPYVLLSYISGGKDNMTNNNGIDMIMQVTCVSNIVPQAEDIANDVERVLADSEITAPTG